MKNVLGTNHFTGLDVSKASHLIEDGSLTKSVNGWTDETGAVKVARGQDIMYSGYSAISCFAAGRQAGEDSLVWMDGNNVYKNGSNVGTINADVDNMYIRDFDDNFYIMGSTDDKNYIYDGDLLRQHGPWPEDNISLNRLYIYTATNWDVLGASKASSCVVTLDISGGGHPYVAGSWVYFDGISGMTELNGNVYTVTAYTSNTITLDQDSSDFTTWSSGGAAHYRACGLVAGDYRYYTTAVIKFADGSVIESNPVAMYHYNAASSDDASIITLDPTDVVGIEPNIDWDGNYDISGTMGVDYWPGIRTYRTKVDGSDFYLEKENYYNDAKMVYSGGVFGYARSTVFSFTKDTSLGAVFLSGLFDRTPPPESSLMELVGQRLFMNDVSNPQRLYFTGLDGLDYVPTLNYLLMPDTITGIGSVGSVCVVFSADRMWRVSMLGGIPDVDEIETAVGTDYGQVMTTTHMGLLFLRKDGLWTTDGSSPPKHVGREAFASINEPTTITAAGDVLYVGDKNTAYIMQDKAGSRNWHEHLVYHTLADATNGRFYAASTTAVYELMAGYRGTATITTKDFTDYVERQITRVIVDYEGSDIPQVLVNGNREGDYDGHPDEGTDRDGNRRLLRFSIPRLHNHVSNVTVTMSGDGVTYGLWMEGE